MFGIFLYFIYLNYDNIGGLISGLARGVYNYFTYYGAPVYNFLLSIPGKIGNAITYAVTNVWDYITSFFHRNTASGPDANPVVPNHPQNGPVLPTPPTELLDTPSDTPSFRELQERLANLNSQTPASGNAAPSIATTGTQTAWGGNTPTAPTEPTAPAEPASPVLPSTPVAPSSPISRVPSYNPGAVGLGLTNSQIYAVSGAWVTPDPVVPASFKEKSQK